MSTKRPPLVNGQIYHIVLRAVDGLKLFQGEKDYLRMIRNLFEFNNKNLASSDFRVKEYLARKGLSKLLTQSDSVNLGGKKRNKRELLVDILAFCLMPNHIHLLLRQLRDGGISKFMQKIGIGYGHYYNKKYERKGHIFGGRYKAVLIKTNEQLKIVLTYIHANPISILFPRWKEIGIQDIEKAIKFIEEYIWSSYQDYLDKHNFPSLTNRGFITKVMGGPEASREFTRIYLNQKIELADFSKVVIE